MTSRIAAVGAIGLGALAVIGATAVGSDAARLEAVVDPPTEVRAALVGLSVALAAVLLSGGLTRLAGGRDDVPGLVRGVRLVFLGLAALAAAAGWLLGAALPLVVGLVIAGVDVVETSFLLLVVGPGRVSEDGPPAPR